MESGCFTLIREKTDNDSAPVPASSSPAPLVTISILNWNGWKDTLECLESVRRLDYPNFLTVVVDNGSTNGSADKIKAWAEANLGPGQVIADYTRETALAGGDSETEQALEGAGSSARLVLVRNEDNLGFTGGNNVAIHYGLTRRHPGEFVFLLNNDTFVSQGCLTGLVATTFQAGAGIAEAAICANGQSVPSAPWLPARREVVLERLFGNEIGPFLVENDFQDVSGVRGAAVLISRKLLGEIFSRRHEFLHEKFFMYAEDIGISIRARSLGFRCVRASSALVWHKGARSSGGKYSPIEYYYGTRNMVLLSKEMSWAGKICTHFVNTPMGLARIIKNVVHRRYRAGAAILYGLVDGYRGIGGKWKWHDREYLLYRSGSREKLYKPTADCAELRSERP